MELTPQYIITTHPEFLDAALNELQQRDRACMLIQELGPGIALCAIPNIKTITRRAAEEPLMFVRHLSPVQAEVKLTGTEQDLETLALAVAELPTFTMLERGQRFAVQTRLLQGTGEHIKRPYSSGQLNKLLAEAIAEETEASESIKKPQIVVSLLCLARVGYLGISTARENLSDWPGGARHFAQLPEQLSRAEFKFLEALEVFGLELPTSGNALDLGAAPGGWTRLLLEAGLDVVAVDPANLDPRLKGHNKLEHYQGYAEDYLDSALERRVHFDLITNDMRMDARDASRMLAAARSCLDPEGIIISVLKLPHATGTLNPVRTLGEALNIMRKSYAIVQARQLFHNRQEVTIVAARPLPTSRRG